MSHNLSSKDKHNHYDNQTMNPIRLASSIWMRRRYFVGLFRLFLEGIGIKSWDGEKWSKWRKHHAPRGLRSHLLADHAISWGVMQRYMSTSLTIRGSPVSKMLQIKLCLEESNRATNLSSLFLSLPLECSSNFIIIIFRIELINEHLGCGHLARHYIFE
jgi:hypothetical protein